MFPIVNPKRADEEEHGDGNLFFLYAVVITEKERGKKEISNR